MVDRAGVAQPVAAATGVTASGAGDDGLAGLLWRHIAQVAGPSLLPQLVELFGLAFLRGVTTFTLADLASELGISVFDGGRITLGSFRLGELFRPVSLAGAGSGVSGAGAGGTVAFRHAAYQELLAAEFLRTPHGRETALAATARPRLTEQVRAFLAERADAAAGGAESRARGRGRDWGGHGSRGQSWS